jgi:hypothetical protein
MSNSVPISTPASYKSSLERGSFAGGNFLQEVSPGTPFKNSCVAVSCHRYCDRN